jgi:hypothetical protein
MHAVGHAEEAVKHHADEHSAAELHAAHS